jgi:CHAT domain-containing protein
LLTSFGGAGSDGLLRFVDIFDLKLDADLVILSACNTASQASAQATQEAGIEGGGGQALDGLVRAFIGAGGRQVIASHWPAPEEFGATRRLFESFFQAKPGTSVADALLDAERKLMDDPQTSHPFYWSGFSLIGDGERPLFPGR